MAGILEVSVSAAANIIDQREDLQKNMKGSRIGKLGERSTRDPDDRKI